MDTSEACFPARRQDDAHRLLRLLVADDNETNRRVLTAILQPIGALVTLAVDGAEAVEAAAKSQFDLILMDIRMPNMDGLEATRRIRADEARRAGRRTPILAVTASALEYEHDEYLAAGLDAIFPKPINTRRLLAAIDDVARIAPLMR